jgi:hypothetical protein
VFHTLVGLKKRKAVLLTVPTPGGVVAADPDPPAPVVPAETVPNGAAVGGGFGACAGEVGRVVGVVAGGADAGDEVAAPGVTGSVGCPAITEVGEADLPFVTTGLVTFLLPAVAALRLVAFARLCDVLRRL